MPDTYGDHYEDLYGVFVPEDFAGGLIVEFSPTTGPFDTPEWIVLTDEGPHGCRVLAASWADGKQADLDEFPPGEATIVLSNNDRLFDPDYTAGTYFGQLNPRVPFRIRAVLDDVGYDLFYGFVEDGWEQTYHHPAGSTCTVKLVDLLAVIQGYTLPGVFEAAVKAADPLGFWILDGPAGTVSVPDLSGTHDGEVFDEPEFGKDPLGAGFGTCAAFDGVNDRIDLTRGQILDQSNDDYEFSIVAVFRTSTEAEALSFHPIFFQSNGTEGTGGSRALFGIETDGTLSWSGTATPTGGGLSYKTAASVADGLTHIGFGDNGGVSVDSPVLETGTYGLSFQAGNGAAIGGTPLASRGYDDNYFEGSIYAVAVWEDLDLATREAIYDGYLSLDGLRSDEQIQWALDQIGVPSSMYDLDEGASIMGPVNAKGRNALEFIRDVARTEQGGFYVEHSNGGKLRLRNRYASFLETRATVSQATFSDDPLVSDVCRVEPDTLQLEANGVQSIINQATVGWLGGEVVVDESAGSPYGPRPVQIETVATNANVARGIGQWVVALNDTPRSRIRSLGIDPGAMPDEFATALTLRIGDRVTYRSKPQNVGTATTKALEVLGRAHEVAGPEWVTTYYLTVSPSDSVDLFTLGTSELGGTHILAY